MEITKLEWFVMVCGLVGNIAGALMIWELCAPESWRLGLPESLDDPLGWLFGMAMGVFICEFGRGWPPRRDMDGEDF